MNRRTPLLLVALLALTGCGGGDMSDLTGYVEQTKGREPGPIEPLPEIQQIDTFVYEAADRRDPFVLNGQAAEDLPMVAEGEIAPDPLRRKEELEQFPLDSIKMVGTLEQDDAVWGLVTAPGGILHKVRVGNYLGANNGQIIRITAEAIELTEIIPDGTNQWRERQAAIALSQ